MAGRDGHFGFCWVGAVEVSQGLLSSILIFSELFGGVKWLSGPVL